MGDVQQTTEVRQHDMHKQTQRPFDDREPQNMRFMQRASDDIQPRGLFNTKHPFVDMRQREAPDDLEQRYINNKQHEQTRDQAAIELRRVLNNRPQPEGQAANGPHRQAMDIERNDQQPQNQPSNSAHQFVNIRQGSDQQQIPYKLMPAIRRAVSEI